MASDISADYVYRHIRTFPDLLDRTSRIEGSYTHEVDMRRIMNEDRERAYLPPL